jgi:hypothetical protein
VAVLIIIGFFIVAAGIIALSLHQQHLRSQFWEELTREWNGTLYRTDRFRLSHEEEYPLFQQGHSRKVEYLLETELEGHQLLFFDYEYRTGSGKHRSTHSLTCMMIETPVYGLSLTLRSENFFDRVVAFVGFDDINFELEEFNRSFRVLCPDKKFAYDVFHTQMMELFLEYRGGLVMEWCGFKVLFYLTPERHFSKLDMVWLKKFASEFVRRLPAYLIEEQRG